jgi:uncharacterized protein (DUF1800 family)
MNTREAAIAARRFGLGPKPGDLRRISSDPRGYVTAALARKDAALLEAPGLDPSHVSLVRMREARQAQQLARAVEKQQAAKDASGAGSMSENSGEARQTMASEADGAAKGSNKAAEVRREIMLEEASARLERAVATDQPFLERLVLFWSNHFCISALKGPGVRVTAGAYEREAIRPHVLGRFADMLRAVEQHPAMLIYLDNAQSIGPNSPAGRNRQRGLNENLAREILELHTVGVGSGYNQGDVTNFARILTGWTVGNVNAERSEPGRFFFARPRHEPGDWTVLGKRYADRGVASGEEVLQDLARHPATARHVATKLAVHFLGNDPPPELTARLEKVFRDTDGDLAAVARALATSPELWEASPRKVVPPYDFVVSIVRGLGVQSPPREAMRLAAVLGQPLWQVPSPKGWPDADDSWMGPSAIRERLRIAERAARAVDRMVDPRALADDLLGTATSESTRTAIARAETREQGLELLLMSPEFLRR